MKRFWRAAALEEVADGWRVQLDTRPVKTPAGRAIVVPLKTLGDEIVAEWDAQTEYVNPLSMPATRFAATCLDRVAPERAVVADSLAAYGETDLLCYRADYPEPLIARQAMSWDPLLDWAFDQFGARLTLAEGVMHVAQPEDAIARLGAEVHKMTVWPLTAMADLVTISGSLVLGLAVRDGRLDGEAAWRLSRIDDQWNIDQWGEDHEAAEQAARRESDFQQAARLLRSFQGG